jgi:hypothetical protein
LNGAAVRPQGPKNGTQKLAGPVQPGSQFERCGGAAAVLHAQSCVNTHAVSNVAIARMAQCAFSGCEPREAVALRDVSRAMTASLANGHRVMDSS